jgi:hypothetical protein
MLKEQENMKSKWLKLILVLLIIFNLSKPFIIEPIKDSNQYVKYSLTSNINTLFITLEGLEDKLIKEEKYSKIDIKEIQLILDEYQDYIYFSNRAISHLETLNSEFIIDMYGLEDFLRYLEKKAAIEIRPSEDDIKTLKSICALRIEYSEVKTLGYYSKNKNPYFKMHLPEKTGLLFKEINEISEEYLDK